jgi:hypothetical protein
LKQLVKEFFGSSFIFYSLVKVRKNLIQIHPEPTLHHRSETIPKNSMLCFAIEEVSHDRSRRGWRRPAGSRLVRLRAQIVVGRVEHYAFYIFNLLYSEQGFWTQQSGKPIVQ